MLICTCGYMNGHWADPGCSFQTLEERSLIGYYLAFLKVKKTHGFNSCIVISLYPLDILPIKKATQYRNN